MEGRKSPVPLRLGGAFFHGASAMRTFRFHSVMECPVPRSLTAGGVMPQFVIEREMPGAGSLSPDDLKMASQTSCSVLRDLGPQIQWVHSYVTDNKIYCVYRAPNEDLIREHAQRGGFPANKISQVRSTIDPTTAE